MRGTDGTIAPGARNQDCPVRDILDRVGDAWSVLVVLTLEREPTRFNALRRAIGDISQRMLTVTLRQLERDGFVARAVIPSTPPQVSYSLTPLGHSLATQLGALSAWAETHQPTIRAHRVEFDGAG